jgi:hypothetical protein
VPKPTTAALITVLLSASALAQGVPVRIGATITAFKDDHLAVRDAEGDTLDIVLPPNVRIGAVTDRTLDSIRPGEFVGSAARRGRDGRLHALEVHIFPEAMRGTGEGHRPMDAPEQTMTNATVDGVAGVADGRTLRLRYPGGEQVIEVAPDVRVVELVPGDRSLLVPGAAVTVRALRTADDHLTAVSVQAEKDGVKPLP